MFLKYYILKYKGSDILEYKSVKEMAKAWDLSERRVRKLCSEGKIPNAYQKGKLWKIPSDSLKPLDRRKLKGKNINEKYISLFSRIDSKNEKLKEFRKNCPLTKTELKALNDNFLVEYTYNTNAIEGNTLTLQETALVLEGVTINKKPLKDHLEILGHKEAFDWVIEMVKSKVKISESFIKDIHSLVLMDKKEDAGVYRRVPVRINGASHTPPQPYLIESSMEELIDSYSKIKKTKHIIEAVSLLHIIFEGIHPFIDGNGRTGRLLINYELMLNGYPPIDIKYKDVKKYYEAFEKYHTEGKDISEMVFLVAHYLEESIDKWLSVFEFKKDVKY